MKIKLLIGCTGTGKTWVMHQIIKKLKCTVPGKVGTVYYMRSEDSKYIVVGKYEGGVFDGSDQLSMAVMASWPLFLHRWKDADTIFIEGQRFTNKKILALPSLEVTRILGDGAEGRKLRGTNQSLRHIKSVETMVNNIVATHHTAKDSTAALKILLKS